jgi:tetratricopeptide (TPR) repeat protein
MPKKAFPILLILVGAALVLGALLSWLDNLTAAQPVGLGKWVFDVLQFLLGAAGTGLGAWLNFGRKDKTPPANRITNIGSGHQTAIGDQARNVQTGAGSVAVGGDVMYSSITIQQTVEKQLAVSLFTIPPPVADFTGREKELAELKAAFARGAVITGVSGAGGIGKTELARRLAQELAADFPAARLSIDLLGTSERPLTPDEAMRRLLEPFYPNQKLPDEPEQLAGLYRQTFTQNKSLLLLDNAADAAQVRPLIPPPPSAAIVTSRQHFTLSEFGLTPLRLDVLPPEEARQFLRATSPKLRDAPDAEVEKLADLCGRLPLALRVAASLLNDRDDWTPATLRKRLADERTRLARLKREGDLDVEAAISLSYNLLDDDLKTRFRQLGVFTAPFLRLSAQAVWGIADEAEADDLLGKLTTRSLLNVSPSPFAAEIEGEAVYALHDLTRLFAYARLLEHREQAEEAIMRHAHHALAWASEADTLYQKGNENILRGLARFRFIWPHLLAAYERLLPEQEPRPRPAEADRWLSDFPGRCAYVLDLHLPPRQQIPLLQAALEAARRLGDRSAEGVHLGNLGNAYLALGDARKAIEFYEKRLAIAQEIGDRRGEGATLGNLGLAYAALGDARKAIEFYEQALAIHRKSATAAAKEMTSAIWGMPTSPWATPAKPSNSMNRRWP